MIELKTKYLGLQLKNPLVASASPLSEELDKVKQMEKGAWCMVHVAGCEPGREFPDTLQPATCNLHHSKTTLNNYN